MSNALPRMDDELWRRTRPDLFHIPERLAPSALRIAGPGRAIPGVAVVPYEDGLAALAEVRSAWEPLREHALSHTIARRGRGGVVVHVGSDVAPGTVIAVDGAVTADEDAAVRNLVIVEPNARVTLVERLTDEGAEGQLLLGTRLEVGAGAQVDYRRYWSFQRTAYVESVATVGENATLKLTTLVDGKGVAKVEHLSRLAGHGAWLEDYLVDKADSGLRIDVFQETHHLAPGTRARVEARGVVSNRAYSLHHGLTRVAPEALDTDTYFTSRHLLLGRKARADAIPKMEIQTDAVSAGHGATSGDLDQEALFYLMSRGMTEETARALLVSGFLAQLLERFPELAEWEEDHVAA